MPGKPHYMPTPEQIAAECAKIRQENYEAMLGGEPLPDECKESRPLEKRVVRNLIDRRKRVSE